MKNDRLVTIDEIAFLLCVARSTADGYKRRPDFPKAKTRSPLLSYSLYDVITWHNARPCMINNDLMLEYGECLERLNKKPAEAG